MKHELTKVLREFDRLEMPVGINHAPGAGGFDFWLGEQADPMARRSFAADELDSVADWLVETVRSLHRSSRGEPRGLWFMR